MTATACRAWVPQGTYRGVGPCECRVDVRDGYCARHAGRRDGMRATGQPRLVCAGCGSATVCRRRPELERKAFSHAFPGCGGAVVYYAGVAPAGRARGA